MEYGLVNGSRGVVIAFKGAKHQPVVRFTNGVVIPIEIDYKFVLEGTSKSGTRDILASVIQTPLRLAWAWTLHKVSSFFFIQWAAIEDFF